MILDMKRSIVSYADTNRLEELKAKMMAAALILPDWLYREHKRLYVDQRRDRHRRRGKQHFRS